jgi:streptogramin lyase
LSALGVIPVAQAAPILPGDLLVADQGGAIFRVDLSTGNREIISSSDVGSGPEFVSPIDLAVDSSGAIVVSDGNAHTVFRVDPSNGDRVALSSSSVGSGPSLQPHGIATHGDRILVTGYHEEAVFEVNPATGERTIISAESTGTGPIDAMGFITAGGSTQPWYVTTGAQEILRIDPNTGDRVLISSTTTGSGPAMTTLYDLFLSPAGDLFITDGAVSGGLPAIMQVDLDTGDRTVVSSNDIGLGPAFDRPQSVVAAPDGSLLVADGGAGAIYGVDILTGDRTLVSSSTVGVGPNFVEPLGILIFPIPEPSTALLLACGLAGLAAALEAKAHGHTETLRPTSGRGVSRF